MSFHFVLCVLECIACEYWVLLGFLPNVINDNKQLKKQKAEKTKNKNKKQNKQTKQTKNKNKKTKNKTKQNKTCNNMLIDYQQQEMGSFFSSLTW